jgi:hypothetical protein
MADITGDIGSSFDKYWPYYVGGFIAVAIIVFLYLKGKTSSSGTVSNFTYSDGPTDAQIAAGTAQQDQQQADQTAVSLANINATASTANTSTFASLLATNSANSLSANNVDSNNALAASETASDNALLTSEFADQTTQFGDTTQANINAQNANTFLTSLEQDVNLTSNGKTPLSFNIAGNGAAS